MKLTGEQLVARLPEKVFAAQVGGKIAPIDSRLIDSTAKRLANQFFRNLVNCSAM